MTKPQAHIFDIDGTLASATWREAFIKRPGVRPQWDVYFEHLIHDAPIPGIVDRLWAAQAHGERIVLLTSRRDVFREQTEFWCLTHRIAPDEILMRRDGDGRRDFDVKRDLYRDRVAPRYAVSAVFEDSPECIAMWRAEGLHVEVTVDPVLEPTSATIGRAVAALWDHTDPWTPGVGPTRA